MREFHEAAGSLLRHSLLSLSDEEVQTIGEAFAAVIRERNYTCYGFAVMPDHVHLLIRKHRDPAEAMIDHLQEASRGKVLGLGHRATEHPVWGGPGWKVDLSSREEIVRTVRYIDENPPKAGRPRQHWPFVKEYDGGCRGRRRSRGRRNRKRETTDGPDEMLMRVSSFPSGRRRRCCG